MKRLLLQTALVTAILYSGPAIAGDHLNSRLEALRHDLRLLANPAALTHVIEAHVLELKSYQYIDETAALPSPRVMQRGQIGIIPASLVLARLNTIQGNSAYETSSNSSQSKALLISAGRLTLKQLFEDASKQFPEALRRGRSGPIVQMPIFIWSDAELVLESGDELALSTQPSSFILNAGVLRMQHAKIFVAAIERNAMAVERPFVTTILGGAIQAQDSVFSGLGFSGVAGLEGVTISNAPLSIQQGQTVLAGNTFEDIGSLSVRHVVDLKMSDNKFIASRNSSIKIEDTANARISNNIFIDGLGQNAIQIGSGSFEIDVVNNAILAGKGEGINVGKGASHIDLSENIVAGQDKAGIAIDRSSCATVHDNIIFNNRKNGVVISRSSGIAVTANHLVQNGDAGVLIRLQSENALTTLADNQFIENATGVRGQAASQIEIANNDLSAQLPIMVSGDFAGSIKDFLSADIAGTRKRLDSTSWATHEVGNLHVAANQTALPCQNGS
jgi:parallel beta-helix repeat protein